MSLPPLARVNTFNTRDGVAGPTGVPLNRVFASRVNIDQSSETSSFANNSGDEEDDDLLAQMNKADEMAK